MLWSTTFDLYCFYWKQAYNFEDMSSNYEGFQSKKTNQIKLVSEFKTLFWDMKNQSLSQVAIVMGGVGKVVYRANIV